MKLSVALRDAHEKWEAEVFRKFVAKPTNIHRQIEPKYRHPNLVSGLIVTGTYIPRIRMSLKYRNPGTPQEATNIIASLLGCATPTAGLAMFTGNIDP